MTALLRPKEAADYLGYSAETLADWRTQSRGLMKFGRPIKGPAWVDGPTGRCRGYTREALDRYLQSREVAA